MMLFTKIFSFYVFLATGVRGILITRPLNSAIDINGEISFNCSSDSSIITWLYTTQANIAINPITLTQGNCEINTNYASHYRTEKPSTNVCNLIVFNAVLSHGGFYTCTDGYGNGNTWQSILIVIDPSVTFTANTTQEIVAGENLVISSKIVYGGPSLEPPVLPPSFYWTLQSDPSRNITSYEGQKTTNTSSSSIIVTSQAPLLPSYLCHVFFHPPSSFSGSDVSSTNAPSYTNNSATGSYQVSYINPPEIIAYTFTEENVCQYQKPMLRCIPDAFPAASVSWFDSHLNQTIVNDANITAEPNGSYTCLTTNTIRGKQQTTDRAYASSGESELQACYAVNGLELMSQGGSNSTDSCTCECEPVTLICSAFGLPAPSIQWTYSGTNISTMPTIEVNEVGTYQCTAYNTINGVLHKVERTIEVKNASNSILSMSACIAIIVVVVIVSLNLILMAIFLLCYGLNKSIRSKCNRRCPWLEDMLPLLNEGCSCSRWIVLFVVASLLVGFIFFPTIMIMSYCCGQDQSKGKGNKDIAMSSSATADRDNLPNDAYEKLQREAYENLRTGGTYQGLQTAGVAYEELSGRPTAMNPPASVYTELCVETTN